MNFAYSSAVRETTTVHETRDGLVKVYEKHTERHGSPPSLKQLFNIAREKVSSEDDQAVISWLESVIARNDDDDDDGRDLSTPPFSPESHRKHHHHLIHHKDENEDDDQQKRPSIFVSPVFFPSEDSFRKLIKTLDGTQKSLDICVYTITDDQLTNAIVRAQDRGVRVRIISDNEKANDLGSDVHRLAAKHGVPTRVDESPTFMHHKFAVLDNALVITGSYNWTKGARFDNREDLTLTNAPAAVKGFAEEFDKLWDQFVDVHVE